ncbi:MAG TPA: double zinc ribbon domain-containing protein [Actinomycetota bacterium]|nr:double zinc ribbon domain-containing protein [Actinomycetota bacterium]
MPALLDLLFPATCAGCARRAWPLCERCTRQVGTLIPPGCLRCGRPLEAAVSRCRDCPPHPIDTARSSFLYDGPIRRAIHGMKFSGWRALGPHLAGAMAETASGVRADAVTWVPLSRRRLRRRGFDQAHVLARHLAARVGLPLRPMLVRSRDTAAQARLSGPDRRRALADVFRHVDPEPPPTRLLLVDDVLTTGATAAACARALKEAGARHVTVLTAARSLEGRLPDRCFGSSRLTRT